MKKYQNSLLSFIVIFVMILPGLLVLSLGLIANTVEAGELEENTNTSWIKGIILILISYITNHFLGEIEDSSQEQKIPEETVISEQPDDHSAREVLGFYVNWQTENSTSLQTLKNNHQQMDMIAPFWYTANPDGNLVQRYGGPQPQAISFAAEKNIPVLPLINNNQTNNNILMDPEIRTKTINNIVSLVTENNYSGVNIDFEFIPPHTREGYTSFIKQLAEELRPLNKKITISVFPKVNVPHDLHGAFDYAELAPHIDRMVIMTYDHSWSTGAPGPIAPQDWVEANILYTLEHVPQEKILLGVANYGYDWIKSGEGNDLGAERAKELARKYNSEIIWDETTNSSYFIYSDQGVEREVWFESSQSLEYKLELVKEYNLQGIAIWRLGNATNRFWDIIEERLR